jgi:hypothetical protein
MSLFMVSAMLFIVEHRVCRPSRGSSSSVSCLPADVEWVSPMHWQGARLFPAIGIILLYADEDRLLHCRFDDIHDVGNRLLIHVTTLQVYDYATQFFWHGSCEKYCQAANAFWESQSAGQAGEGLQSN